MHCEIRAAASLAAPAQDPEAEPSTTYSRPDEHLATSITPAATAPCMNPQQQRCDPQQADGALPAAGTPGEAAEHLQQPALKANIVLPAAGEAWQCHAARGGPGHLSMAH